MNTLKNVVLATLLLLTMSAFSAKSHAQSYEMVVGSVSGSLDAGESYELYKSSADSFGEYLAGWRHLGFKDNTRTYSLREVYDKCLDEAKRQYGREYPDLDIVDFEYKIEDVKLEDIEYYSQVVGSSAKFKKKLRSKRVYLYSATVVVNQ